MTLIQAVILGGVQGLTEFLPVSSSGHLVLSQALFGIEEPMVAFDIALHGGTLLAVLVYFYADIRDILTDFWRAVTRRGAQEEKNVSGLQPPFHGVWISILVTMLPTGILAFFFKDLFEKAFSDLLFVACAWLVMGTALILSGRFQQGTKDLSCIRHGDAFWIGLAQGFALAPGISRSGSTILAGMALGLRRETAAKFSFLISVPVVAGAVLLDLKRSLDFFEVHPGPWVAGFATSAVTGYLVVRWLMSVIQKGRFFLFGYYCLVVGLFAFAVSFLSN
ncbi:MAG: undecaprenyl-diphosphate phosphatase [Candidatus Omnitrophica bacterium]|nr:undecaprenyl-diphosphate phosphatase [Candidatus Omnitrophota bacterium]